jgi:cysteine synthase B
MPNYPTIEACIGGTPLVRLQRLPGDTSNTVLAKLEGNNPAGSVKDRPALSMIAEAEARGDIRPGDRSSRRPAATRGSPWPWPRRSAATGCA